MDVAQSEQAGRLGSVFRDMRLARGWSQRGMAEQLGVSQTRISRIECQREQPSMGVLTQALRALDPSPGERESIWTALAGTERPVDWTAQLEVYDFNEARYHAARLLSQGSFQEAYGYIRAMEMLAVTPERRACASAYLGNRSKDLGQWIEAGLHYDAALRVLQDVSSEKADAVRSLVHVNRADLFRVRGDLFTAISVLEALLQSDTLTVAQAAYARLSIGRARLDSGDATRALRHLEQAVCAFETLIADPRIRPTLIWQYRLASTVLGAALVASGRDADGGRRLLARSLRETDDATVREGHAVRAVALAYEASATRDLCGLDEAQALVEKHDLAEERGLVRRIRAGLGAAALVLCLALSAVAVAHSVSSTRAAPVAAPATQVAIAPFYFFEFDL